MYWVMTFGINDGASLGQSLLQQVGDLPLVALQPDMAAYDSMPATVAVVRFTRTALMGPPLMVAGAYWAGSSGGVWCPDAGDGQCPDPVAELEGLGAGVEDDPADEPRA